ncbi:MAG TPA: hypothetical protein VKS01_09260, partial [Bryobacteraceae bacterium]|nr:hypothetical protein [Bryobacteraceae bacterium]
MKRTLLAGLAAGVAMYIWSSIAHLALPLGSAGVSQIPNEQPLVDQLNKTLGPNAGLYAFPAMDARGSMDDYSKKLASNPSGLLAYTPPGASALTSRQLVVEFATELTEGYLLVFLLAATRLVTFGARLGFATGAGMLAALATNLPYWNWYHF